MAKTSELTDRLDATDSIEGRCELRGDASIPLHEARLKAAVYEMVKPCADEHTVDHVEAALYDFAF
jgi:hypothetical protein